MDILSIILGVLLLGALIAVILVAVHAHRKEDSLQNDITALTGEKSALEARLEAQAEAQRQLDAERAAASERERLQREESLAREREQAARAMEEMRGAFKALSAENSEHFREQSTRAVDELLKPIKEKFEAFDRRVRESDVRSAERNTSLEGLIKMMADQSKTVGTQAQALADAITGQSKVQGDFGEMLLTDLLRASGLEEGPNFSVQSVIRDAQGHEIKSEDGRTLIPDVIVHYPDGGEVIVDSKVSLKAFVAWNQAASPEERARLAREHVQSIRSHVDELKTKNYASYIPEGHKKIDYNLMFIPVENAFVLMEQEAPLLWQEARNAGVLIVSQMSLSVVLNMVQIAWRRQDQERNIEEVYNTASELMSVLQNWMESYVKIGESLEKVSSAYNESTRQLKDSNQSVIKKIGKLERLRVAPKRSKAGIKSSGRMVGGRESIIPSVLAQDMPDETATEA